MKPLLEFPEYVVVYSVVISFSKVDSEVVVHSIFVNRCWMCLSIFMFIQTNIMIYVFKKRQIVCAKLTNQMDVDRKKLTLTTEKIDCQLMLLILHRRDENNKMYTRMR